jgi:hypothetical protein
MRRILVVAVMAGVLGASAPGSATVPDPATPPAGPRPAETPRGPTVVPPPPAAEGCVLPVSAGVLQPCPPPRQREPAASCVLPVLRADELLPPCPPRPLPDRGQVVPLQSLRVE